MRKILAAAALIFSAQSAFAQAMVWDLCELFDYVLAAHGLDGFEFKSAPSEPSTQPIVQEDPIEEEEVSEKLQ